MKRIPNRRTPLIAILCALALSLSLAAELAAQTGRPGTPPTTPADRGGGSASSDRDDGPRIVPGDRRLAETARVQRRPEFVLYGPPAALAAAEAALLEEGARLLRIRPLPAFAAELRVYDFRGRIGLGDAQDLVERTAAGAVLDLNTIYRFAQGGTPRLYAAGLLGEASGACRLRRDVTVGMIDGPVARGHPALAAADVTVLSSLLPSDSAVGGDHGTAVAALLVGEDPGGVLSGFARGARLIAVSAFAQEMGEPGADLDRIAGALDALVRSGSDVINMSFAGPPNAVFDALLSDTGGAGVILVGAAGNTNSDAVLYPAAAPDVIAVTAIDAGLRRFRRASFGASIEFAAPGVDVYVADAAGGGRYASGTSFAAPIVAAMVARLEGQGIRSTAAHREALRRTSRDIGAPGRDRETGWGLISAPGC